MNGRNFACTFQVLVHLLADERCERSHDGNESAKHIVHRLICLNLGDGILLEPHSWSDQLHIPAGKLVENEGGDWSGCTVKVSCFHLFGDLLCKGVHAGDKPSVLAAELCNVSLDNTRVPLSVNFLWNKAVERHVRQRELVNVP